MNSTTTTPHLKGGSATTPIWPERYLHPADVQEITAIDYGDRGVPATTWDALTRAAAEWPDTEAVVILGDAAHPEQHRSATFAELASDVTRVANLLRSSGVARTDAVTLMSSNCYELIVATLASQAAGIVAPINPGLSTEHIRRLMDTTGSSVLIAAGPDLDGDLWEKAKTLAATSPTITTLFALRSSLVDAASSATDLGEVGGVEVSDLFLAASRLPSDRFDGIPPSANDLASFFHTGGTTGAPKLAAHTHANEVANAWMVTAPSFFHHGATFLAALPLFHVNALIVTVLGPLLRGMRVVWAPPLGYRDPHLLGNLWRLIERFRITGMSAVPTVYQALAAIPVTADISSLKAPIVGAAPLPVAVEHAFKERTGVELLQGYGLTEATCATLISLPESTRRGAVGTPMPYLRVRVAIADDAGGWSDAPIGQVGTLLVQGPTVFPGYVVGRNDGGFMLDGLGKVDGGWLNTGDLATIDEDGFISLVGRSSDIIIRGGHNIDPGPIEDAMLAHPAVTGAAAVGRPDAYAGELPVVYVSLSETVAVTEDDLVRWAKDHVGEPAAVPKRVVVIDAIPVTAVGKPHKVPLRAREAQAAYADALAEVAGVASVDAVSDDGALAIEITLASSDAQDAAAAAVAALPIRIRFR
ncbi:acyl-CoA synthetase [Microbacterium sp. GXF7504]